MSRMAIIAPARAAPAAPPSLRPRSRIAWSRATSLASASNRRSASASAAARRRSSSRLASSTSSSTATRLRQPRSDDLRRRVAPVAVAEQSLVELARRQPRQLVLEVDAARALEVGEVGAAERQQLLLQRRTRLDAVDDLDDGLDLLAEVLVGHADDRRVHHLGVRDEQVLGLLRV